MSQDQILKVLGKEKRWMQAKEICGILNLNGEAVRKALNSMFKYNEVNRKKCKQKKTCINYKVYFWKFKLDQIS